MSQEPPIPEIPDHQLLKQIGSGGYGDVWLAKNIMGDFRAVKVVRRDRFESSRPFDREFEGIQKFEPVSRTHDSQLDILHVGRNGDYFYYVMEVADDVLNGQDIDPVHYAPHTLRSDILERGRLPFDECLKIALSLTTALEHLHGAGLVHRDIKPSNVIFIHDQPKLADIGLVTDSDATMTMVGTEGYLPPEGPGKPSADLYSLGKVLYEISTGLDRTEFPELPTGQHLLEDRARFAELNEVVTKACNTDPSRRYETAAEMRENLLQIQAGGSLIRSRLLEKRVQWLKRAAVIGGILLALAGSGYLYQKKQTERAEQLTQQLVETTEDLRNSSTELKQKTAEAQSSAKAAIAANYHLHNQNAIRFMKEGDLQEAALWSHSALQLAEPNSDEAWAQQYRIDTLLSSLPEVLDHVDASAYGHNPALIVATHDEQSAYLVNANPNLYLVDPMTGDHTKKIESVSVGISSLIGKNKLMEADLGANVFKISDIDTGAKLVEFDVIPRVSSVGETDGGDYILVQSTVVIDETRGSTLECFSKDSGDLVWSRDFDDDSMSVEASDDGKFVACSIRSLGQVPDADVQLLLLDGKTGKTLDRLKQPGAKIAKFSKDSETLLYISDSPQLYRRLFACSIVDGKFGEPWQIDESLPDGLIRIPGNRVYNVPPTQFHQHHPDRIFITRSSSMILYDLKSKSVIETFPELKNHDLLNSVMSTDERFIATQNELNEVWLYDLVEGGEWQRVIKHYGEIADLNFTSVPDRLVVTGIDKSVRLLSIPRSAGTGDARLFDLKLSSRNPIQWIPETPDRPVIIARTNANGQTLSAYTLDLQSLRLESFLPEVNNIQALAINTQSNLVAVGTITNGLEIWNFDEQERVFHDTTYTNYPSRLEWNASGSVLAGATADRNVFVLNYGENPSYIFEHDFKQSSPLPESANMRGIDALDWDPKGEYLIASSENHKLLWAVDSNEVIELNRDTGPLRAASFSPDGNRLAMHYGSTLAVGARSNLFSVENSVLLSGSGPFTADMAWSHRSDKLLTVELSVNGPGRAHLWNLNSRPNGHDRTTMMGTNTLRILTFNEEKGDHTLEHDAQISAVAYGPDGKLIASGDVEGTLNIWSAHSAELLVTKELGGGGIADLFFSPDGQFLLCTMENRALQIVDTGLGTIGSANLTKRLRLLCGGTYDNQGRFIPARTGQLLEDLEVAKRSRDASIRESLNWHASQLRDIVFQGDVSTSLAHVEQLIKLQPENEKWAKLKNRLLAVKIPPRDPNLPEQLIDLSKHYNSNLHENSEGSATGTFLFNGRNHFASLGAGTHKFGDVEFDIRGIIHLAGPPEYESIQKYFRYPKRVNGIEVNQHAKSLHFIHATEAPGGDGHQETRPHVGSYEIVFSDGSREIISLQNNVNLGDWWFDPERPATSLKSIPEAKVAWTGENEATLLVNARCELRLFQFQWNNPHPNKKISHIDFESNQIKHIPFLLAITVEP